MKRQTPERCSCFLSLSLFLLSIVAYTRRTHARKRERARAHTITPQTPMMKTKRAFLRNSIRGARTLVFSPPDSSGLPGREQLQAFLCFLGCLRRIIFFCGVFVSASARLLARVFVCVCVVLLRRIPPRIIFFARVSYLAHSHRSFLLPSRKRRRELSRSRGFHCIRVKPLENDSQIANCGVVIWNI
jgi:hypothetical protein